MHLYWVILIGTLSAVILGKHVYGGLGQNPFNPAMVGYGAIDFFPTTNDKLDATDFIIKWATNIWGFAFFNFHRLNHRRF